MLHIRLCDKADVNPTSDIKIKNLVEYFERHGSATEKQEVYYYAGSIYHDLQDTPRALENFFKSIDCATDNGDCDSIMLRNTYSNLSFLQYRVQNYAEAGTMAKEEERLSRELGLEDVISYMHIAAAYKATDNTALSIAAYDHAFEIIVHSNDKSQYQEGLIRLLMDYSILGRTAKAKMCLPYIDEEQPEYLSILKDKAYARLYEACGNRDSSIIYCKRVLDEATEIADMYDIAKQLYCMYAESGDVANAYKYAHTIIQLSDSLDFGKRQEQAATVNNMYRYHLDQKKEQSLREGKEKYRMALIYTFFTSVLAIAIALIFHIRGRNRHLRKAIELSSELKRLSDIETQLHKEIEAKGTELLSTEESLAESTDELNHVKQECARINSELTEYKNTLKEKELLLSEKMQQNRTFIKLLHKSEIEEEAEEVLRDIRKSSSGKRHMTSTNWKQLYQAVDELYPHFKDKFIKEHGTFTEQQMQVCYLMRIGLSNPQIQNLTTLSRVTIWRWVKKYDWVLTQDEVSFLSHGSGQMR